MPVSVADADLACLPSRPPAVKIDISMSQRSVNRAAKAAATKPEPAPSIPAAPPLVAPQWLKPAILLLAAALMFVWFSGEVADSDTWWHLKTGQYIVQTHKMPDPDPFAYTTANAGSAYADEPIVRHFNLTHEWLSQIILYLAYAVGGFPGLIILRVLLLMGVCALSGLVAHKRAGSFYWSVAAAVATAVVAMRYAADRPFLFTFLFAAATFTIMEYRRWMWALPPMFLIWANMHGGFFLGWVILGVYCADAVFFRGAKLEPEDRKLFLITGVSVAVSLLNPNFLEPLWMTSLYRQSKLQVRLWEWQHTAFWPIESFQALVLLALASLLLAGKRARFTDWFFFLGFSVAAFWAVRNVMLFAIVSPFLIATYFPWRRKLPAIGEFAAAGLLVIAIGASVAQGSVPQFRAADWKFPWGAAKFLEDHHIQSRMFNSYLDGGFFIWRLWPQQKVFIDGRALSDNVFEDFTKIAYNEKNADPRKMLDQYGVNTIVLDGFEYTSGEPFRLVPVLALSRPVEWHLVYWDATATVFMRDLPQGVAPLDNNFGINAIEAQCQNHIAHDPYHPRCARGLALLYQQLGEKPRARAWMEFYRSHESTPDPEADAIYGRLIAQ
jgi:hypothetical protein